MSHRSPLLREQWPSQCCLYEGCSTRGRGSGQGWGSGQGRHRTRDPAAREEALSGAAMFTVPAVRGQEAAGSQLALNQLPG